LCLGKPPEESTMAQGLSCKLWFSHKISELYHLEI
jgi:hypothetical protein